MMRGRAGYLLGPVVTALLAGAIPTSALAAGEVVGATALKAAFLYNFAKFAEWPSAVLRPGDNLRLCVVGDDGVADALGQTINGRGVDNHELTVEVVKFDGPLLSCHLLYVSGLDAKRTSNLLDALNGTPIFTVSDGDRFAEMGGVAQLVQENGRMHFVVNVSAALRAKLKISSQLLSLAKIIKDEHDAPR